MTTQFIGTTFDHTVLIGSESGARTRSGTPGTDNVEEVPEEQVNSPH